MSGNGQDDIYISLVIHLNEMHSTLNAAGVGAGTGEASRLAVGMVIGQKEC